jgi:hypothetical protein
VRRAHIVMLALVAAYGCAGAPSEIDELNAALAEFFLTQAQEQMEQGLALQAEPDKARPHFHEAAAHYDRLRRRGFDNPSLFLNLGNAHILADDKPRAIFAYRLGLDRSGHHPRLQENLDYARQFVNYPAGNRGSPTNGGPAWLPRPSTAQLLIVAGLLYVVACIGVTRWLMTRRGSLLALATCCGMLAILAGGKWGWDRWQRERETPLVVIAAESVPLRKGNGSSFPPAAEMPTVYRGMEARRLGERGGWLQIEFAGGDVGWVPRDTVLVDE